MDSDKDEIDCLKAQILKLTKERDVAIIARDDHFRNAQNLAQRLSKAEIGLQVVKAALLNPSDTAIERLAKLLFCHEENQSNTQTVDVVVESPVVAYWFNVKGPLESLDNNDKTCLMVADDFRNTAKFVLNNLNFILDI